MFFLFFLIICTFLTNISNGQPDSDAEESKPSQFPDISGLLLKMLQSSGYKAQLPVRQVALNFTLTEAQIKYFAKMTDLNELKKDLKKVLIERIVDTAGHRKVEEHIINTLKQSGFNVEIDEFNDSTPIGTKKFRNIIGTYNLDVSKRILLACHYDSKILEGEVFMGATDSAVPCTIILDIAKKLSPILKTQKQPSITLQLVFFDGEEAFKNWTNTDSLYGSRHLAKKWASKSSRDLDRINAFLLLDLLGVKNPSISHTTGHGTKHLFDRLIKIEKHLNETGQLRKIGKIFNSFEIAGPIVDDHMPFMERRVPIMHLISFVFPENWHTSGDNEKSLDMDTIYNLATILRVFVAGYLHLIPPVE